MTGKALVTILALTLSAFAQSEEPKFVANVEGFRYPRIATQARIEGEFVFVISGPERRLKSQQSNVGDVRRLLAEAAEKNLDTWRLPPLDHGHYEVTYRFVLLDKPVCEYPARLLPPQVSSARSGDDLKIEVLVQATHQCPQAYVTPLKSPA